jgi:hypothetical protein
LFYKVSIIVWVARTKLCSNDLAFLNLWWLRRGFAHPQMRLDLDAVRKDARRCSEVQRPVPRDLIVTDLLTLGVDLFDCPAVESLVLLLDVQP